MVLFILYFIFYILYFIFYILYRCLYKKILRFSRPVGKKSKEAHKEDKNLV